MKTVKRRWAERSTNLIRFCRVIAAAILSFYNVTSENVFAILIISITGPIYLFAYLIANRRELTHLHEVLKTEENSLTYTRS